MRCVGLACAVAVAAAVAPGCHAPVPCATAACTAACPRDASPAAGGRDSAPALSCACAAGLLPVAGACVPPAVADAYCGAPAHAVGPGGGCAFPVCASDEVVDADAGCVPLPSLAAGGPRECPAGDAMIVEERRTLCVPADAACPRGSSAGGGGCVFPPACPAGALPAGKECRPVVQRGPGGSSVVDAGAWAALVLGPSGGPGTAQLCRPLQAHPLALGLGPGETRPLELAIALSFPDEDVTRVSAAVTLRPTPGPPPPPAAAALAARAVAGLIEPLRGLGGSSSAAEVEVQVQCVVARLR